MNVCQVNKKKSILPNDQVIVVKTLHNWPVTWAIKGLSKWKYALKVLTGQCDVIEFIGKDY